VDILALRRAVLASFPDGPYQGHANYWKW